MSAWRAVCENTPVDWCWHTGATDPRTGDIGSWRGPGRRRRLHAELDLLVHTVRGCARRRTTWRTAPTHHHPEENR